MGINARSRKQHRIARHTATDAALDHGEARQGAQTTSHC